MSQITGTLINYYFHCKTQCWLHANRINLEDNSEDVRVGRVLHEIAEKKGKSEVSIDNVKVDKITKEFVVEIKKSDSDIEATRWQVLLYLYKLKQKGVLKRGKIEFIEKNRQNRKVHFVDLDERSEEELMRVLQDIDELVKLQTHPKPQKQSKCKRCAYFEYCFI